MDWNIARTHRPQAIGPIAQRIIARLEDEQRDAADGRARGEPKDGSGDSSERRHAAARSVSGR
jgi:hypothetical protein